MRGYICGIFGEIALVLPYTLRQCDHVGYYVTQHISGICGTNLIKQLFLSFEYYGGHMEDVRA